MATLMLWGGQGRGHMILIMRLFSYALSKNMTICDKNSSWRFSGKTNQLFIAAKFGKHKTI